MQNAALAALGEDAIYTAFDVPPARLAEALAGLGALGVRGANLTIPHKEAALALLDEVSPEAALVGAVNTVSFADGRRVGDNTDGRGFLRALRAAGFDLRPGCPAVVLGAGGSARAVAAALAAEGARLVLANRTPERAGALAALLNERFGAGTAQAVALERAALADALAGAALLVNTTSVGMAPHADAPLLVSPETLRPGLFVYDLVYNPAETRLLAAARARGCGTANGLGMLAHQGALALEFWLGRPAPVAVMEAALRETLLRRGQEGGRRGGGEPNR
jgi:shikimate dehydrogenase